MLWHTKFVKMMKRVAINEKTGCWLFTGHTDDGYGRVGWNGRLYTTHRLIAHWFYNLDLGNRYLQACHSCDVRHCINPLHIWIGTNQENVTDCIRKGRR